MAKYTLPFSKPVESDHNLNFWYFQNNHMKTTKMFSVRSSSDSPILKKLQSDPVLIRAHLWYTAHTLSRFGHDCYIMIMLRSRLSAEWSRRVSSIAAGCFPVSLNCPNYHLFLVSCLSSSRWCRYLQHRVWNDSVLPVAMSIKFAVHPQESNNISVHPHQLTVSSQYLMPWLETTCKRPMPLSKVLHFYPAFLFAYFNCVIVLSNLYFCPTI